MSRRQGRAYLFIRWRMVSSAPGRFGDLGWAFENIDSEGRFYCFHCGAVDLSPAPDGRTSWSEKCFTLPELIKAMSSQSASRPGFDEAKIFEVDEPNPDRALKLVQRQIAGAPSPLPMENVFQVLNTYGVRGLTSPRAFSVPFLWYNILPGRSVPLRRLAVHLFENKTDDQALPPPLGPLELERAARQVAQNVDEVRAVGECFVTRLSSGFLVALNISVDPELTVAASRAIADQTADAIRAISSDVRHLYVIAQPHQEGG